MNFFKVFIFTCSIFLTCQAVSCDFPEGEAYPSIVVRNTAIVFDLSPIEDYHGDTKAGKQIGIDINLFNCKSKSRKLIGQLPFLADTGKVKAAFFAGMKKTSEERFFIIHSVDVRSDTGERNSGGYYTVQVYKSVGDEFLIDEKLSGYFGYGTDIYDKDYKGLIYTFPYKTESSIVSKLNSEEFISWSSGAPQNLRVNKKTYIYSSPVIGDVTKMYLVAGDEVKQEAVEAGWVSMVYTSGKGKKISGWVLCADTDGC
ncbi:hypothetical protein KDX30_21505 [Pseudomonas sp. CDFA 553]|uniref:hypothetical protein n=1 Tax=Pseudomonas quasicaspiana TaxID=2829821 RepID=UPI001E2B2738|nr:hypothetical protein [Pseudomonas quasicaspiana]MCD5990462.1 hypothetical protein [Pseudomonas quasicaspiana]